MRNTGKLLFFLVLLLSLSFPATASHCTDSDPPGNPYSYNNYTVPGTCVNHYGTAFSDNCNGTSTLNEVFCCDNGVDCCIYVNGVSCQAEYGWGWTCSGGKCVNECAGKADLSVCEGGGGKCCGQQCDISKNCAYNENCQSYGDVCVGTSWECVTAQHNGQYCAWGGSECTNQALCQGQHWDWTCSAGQCNTKTYSGSVPEACDNLSCGVGSACCGGLCTDISSNSSNCGSCGNVCPSNTFCSSGSCFCSAGWGDCDEDPWNGCESNLNSNQGTCGSCYAQCWNGTCTNGTCLCSIGYTNCGGNGEQCVNTSSDPNNCGTCGNQCTGGKSCQNGLCVCPSGTSECGGQCVNCQNSTCLNGVCACNAGFGDCDGDNSNGCETDLSGNNGACGSCTNNCEGGSGCVYPTPCTQSQPTICYGSPVYCQCQGSWRNCNGLQGDGCEVNTNTSTANCGSCGNNCGQNSVCNMGTCGCQAGWGNCSGGLVDGCETNTNTSNSHCGACNNACTGGKTCQNGACACPAGTTLCGGTCINTATDPSNCGGCGNVCSNGTCSGGVCNCSAGWGNCDGSNANGCETNTNTSNSHCGACNSACGTNSSCNNGACACSLGWNNCDGSFANGCEVSFNGNTSHCGACGNACNSNATCTYSALCSGANPSQCYGSPASCSCSVPYKNCDGVQVNGCEINTSNDNANCGSCGNACSGNTTCVNSSCINYTPISACSTLSTPGETYGMTANISNSSTATCMSITADNVTLDCQGKTIDGTDGATQIAVKAVGRTGITVKNCNVTDWAFGIQFDGTSNSSIFGNTATSITNNGIYLLGASNNNSIHDNTASSNGNVGISLEGTSSNNVITANTANNNAAGIYLGGGGSNSVTSNTVSFNGTGISLSTTGNNNTIRDNLVHRNTSYGIRFWSTVAGNKVYGNDLNNSVDANLTGGISRNDWNGMGSWAFESFLVTGLDDWTANFWDLTIQGSPSQAPVDARWGSGYSFSGSGQSLQRNGDSGLHFAGSVTAFFVMTRGSNNAQYIITDTRDSAGFNNPVQQLTIRKLNNTDLQVYWYTGSVSTNQVTFTAALPDDGVHAYAVIRDAGAKTVTLVRDGVLVGTQSYASNTWDWSGGPYFSIGRLQQTTSGSEGYFDGSVYEVRMWNTAKPASLMQQLTNSSDTAYKDKLVGDETAAWLFESVPSSKANLQFIGNYWASPSHNGFSQTCTDADKDEVCDSPFTLAAQNLDYRALAKACRGSLVLCSGSCFNLQTDNSNCGSCGNACGQGGKFCSSGSCVCPSGQTDCSGTCRNLQTDNSNCGSCGNACGGGKTCQSGVCSCPTSETTTISTPFQVTASDSYTGWGDCSGQDDGWTGADSFCKCSGFLGADSAANNPCFHQFLGGTHYWWNTSTCPVQTQGWFSGPSSVDFTQVKCLAPATPGDCGGTCFNLLTSNSNCGSCGNACFGGKFCSSGSCVCPSGQTDCSGTCRNLQTDNSNCGSCGNACTGGTVCHQGQCLSSLSITSCGVLSTNGLTYVLTSDISDRSTALCMTIGANNVTLDCQGRKIDGVDSGVGVEIGTGRTGVKVENCVVSDWVYGIEVRGTASDNEVAGNVLKSNLGAGVRLEQTDGIPANNKFYNNWFANLQNVAFSGTQGSNAWSVQRTPGPNIAGGSFITGNFWETPYETGHSQTCSDANNDGVCDKNYKLNNSNTDASPLKAPKKQFFSCNSCESCSALLSQGKNVALSGVTQAVSAAGSCINWQVGSDADGDKTQILDCLGATIEKSSSTMILGPETTGISVGGTGAGVDLVVLKNCRVSGFTNGISISLDSGKDVRLLNNVLTENDNGITTSALHDLHLYFNTVIGSSKGLSEWLLDWLLGGWSSNYGLESYPRTLGVKDNCFCYHNKYDALAYYNDLEDASGNVCGVALDGEGGNVSLKFQGWSDPTGISSALANLLGGPYSYSNIPCDYTCDTSSLAPNTCLAAQNVLKESVCGDGVCDDSIETCASCEADCNRCDCPPSTYRCDGKCISYSADPQNCGGCKAEGEGENCLEKTRPLAGQQVPAPEVCWGPGSPNAYGTCGVFTCAVHDDCATLNIMNFVYKCCGNENATVFACTSVNSSASVLNCGACGNQCGSGGNAGRPYCCPSGGTFACSSAPCPPSLPDV